MDKSETRVEILGTITGARAVGMRDVEGNRLREVYVLITEQAAEQLSMGDLVTLEVTP